jgi:hypothetical protein
MQNLCEIQGARSVSDLARCALSQMIKGPNHPGDDEICRKLQQLEESLSELHRRLDHMPPYERSASTAHGSNGSKKSNES